MAKRDGKKKNAQKTLRMPTRTVFALEVCALLEKKTETEVNETAIEKHARRILRGEKLTLAELFHENEGVRWLNVYLVKGFPLNDEHEWKRRFVIEHLEFFTRTGVAGQLEPYPPAVETLWPKLGEYRALGQTDYWASGRAMALALESRSLSVPAWPPKDAR